MAHQREKGIGRSLQDLWMSNLGRCVNKTMFCFEIYSCRERLSQFVLAYVMGRGRLRFIFNDQHNCTAARECLDSLGPPTTVMQEVQGTFPFSFLYVFS